MTFNANDQTTLSGLFKRVYADNEKDVLVYDDTFARLAPFQEADRQGDVWCLPLVLGMEQGYHAASDGSLFAVTASVPSEVKQAQVNATQSQMNTRVSLATVYRSLSKEAMADRLEALYERLVTRGASAKSIDDSAWSRARRLFAEELRILGNIAQAATVAVL